MSEKFGLFATHYKAALIYTKTSVQAAEIAAAYMDSGDAGFDLVYKYFSDE